MANLKNRINRLTKLRGPVEQKGINSLDLFVVGALAGLYSKKLIIQNDVPNVNKKLQHKDVSNQRPILESQKENSDNLYAEKIKSISSVDRLSTSVSDYILKLEKEDYSDYSRGFYTSQIDNLAKVFAAPSTTVSLTAHAKNSIASMKLDATSKI